MIPELAQQSIQTKIELKSATMLGNYEFYYAAGILCRKLGLDVEEQIHPKELYDFIRMQTDGKELADQTAAHLAEMIRYYIPEESYDSQMEELLRWGLSGKQ